MKDLMGAGMSIVGYLTFIGSYYSEESLQNIFRLFNKLNFSSWSQFSGK